MLYILGGVSRSGKSTLCDTLTRKYGFSHFSFDFLMEGIINGHPQFGMDADEPDDSKADKLWPIEKAMMENMLWGLQGADYLLEGVTILPKHVAAFMEEYPASTTAVWLGLADSNVEAEFTRIKSHAGTKRDWLSTTDDVYIRDHMRQGIEQSIANRRECARLGIPYVETSQNFTTALHQAECLLMGDKYHD